MSSCVLDASAMLACLALAQRLGLPAMTADRIWQQVQIGVVVQLIR